MKPLTSDPTPPPVASDADGQQLAAWLASVAGRYLLAWEQERFDEAVTDCFGYHALQLGLPQLDALRANRMPKRWLAVLEPSMTSAWQRRSECGHEGAPLPPCNARVALVTHAAALPFAENTLDLVVLPHTLEFSADPHAVLRVDSAEHAPVEELGPQIESHARFPRRVNAGFMEVVDRGHIRLRVFERGSGETLACGSGACAAVVAGIRLGWLDATVHVDMPGGRLTIAWAGPGQPVMMTGPAVKVFDGEIDIPDTDVPEL